jgi:hypothetical protein
MADETVNIKIKIDAKTRELRKVMAELGALKKMERRFASGRTIENYAQSTTRSISGMASKWKRSFDEIDAATKMTGKFLGGFLKLAIKSVIIEMALLSATMIGVHALFKAGQFLVKAYQGAMQFLAGGAAAAAMAIGTVAAAIREQQAAMFAYRGKGAKEFGSSMNQTRMAMRNLQSDVSLAGLGVDSLNKAFGVMSKTMNMAQINASNKTIRALMDFGSAGQDPAKAVEQVAAVVAALSNQKKGIGDVMAEAKKLGPEMQKALKDANIKTKDQFKELLFSGKLAEKGGVAGQFEAVNNTLIGQLKAYFGVIRSEFADFGDQFLEPTKKAFEEVFGIIRRDLARASAAIAGGPGFESFTGGFVTAIDKLSNWMVTMLREYLPKAQGMFERMGNWFFNFRRGWNLLLDKLRPLIDGARVLYKAWDPIWEAIKRGADNLTLFRELIIKNEDSVAEFGQRIGDLIDSLAKYFMNMKKMFADMAPFINDLLAGVKMMFDLLSKMQTLGAGNGLASALAPLFGFAIAARGMKSVKGMMMPGVGAMSTQQMNVTAGTVNVGSAALTGPTGPSEMSRLASGGRAAAVGGSPSEKKGAAATLASAGSAAKVSGSPKEFAGPGKVTPNMSLGASVRMGYQNVPGAENTAKRIERAAMRRDAALAYAGPGLTSRMGESIRSKYRDLSARGAGTTAYAAAAGMTSAERGGLSASEYAAGGPTTGVTYGQAMKNSLTRAGAQARYAAFAAADRGQLLARRVAGAAGRGMDYMRMGAWDPELTNPDGSKGGFINVQDQRQAIADERARRVTERGGRRFARASEGMRAFRQNMRIERNSTRFGAAQQKFGKSFGGRMGTAMGLGMASQYAPEEMRGAMALGATVSQLDPRLGIAVAGLGGAMTARGGLKGGLAGAAGGAALGAQFGGAYGALAGAVIGGVFGVIKGTINKGAYEMKQAREAARESINSVYAAIATSAGQQFERNRKTMEAGGRVSGRGAFGNLASSFAGGRLRTAQFLSGQVERMRASGKTGNASIELIQSLYNNQADLGLSISKDQLAKMTKNSTAASEALETYGINARQKRNNASDINYSLEDSDNNALGINQSLIDETNAYNKIQKVNTDRVALLTKMTGKSGAELEILAKELGVNLYDSTIKFNDLVVKLGLNMVRTAAEMQAALVDVMLAAGTMFRTRREAREATLTIDQSTRGLMDTLTSGGLSGQEKTFAVESYFENYFQQILAATGGDAKKAYLATVGAFGTEGQGVYGAGAALEGQYGVINPVYQQGIAEVKKGIGTEYGGQLQAMLGSLGYNVDIGQASRMIGQLSDKDMTKFLNLSDRNALFTGKKGDYTQEDIVKILGTVGLGGLSVGRTPEEALDAIATQAENLAEASEGLKTAIETFNKYTNDLFQGPLGGKPEWWSKSAMAEIMGKDTTTPRGDTTSSRLSQTMARHASMDSQLTGKRSVTSAYRTVGLGSINSDHVTGRAYDLVGQNLGAYSRLVHENGGFAEFHGTQANRHLHVVPARAGDTSSPMAPMGMSTMTAGSGGSTNYFNIEINGATQSPEAIANMVMAKIAEKERNARERS